MFVSLKLRDLISKIINSITVSYEPAANQTQNFNNLSKIVCPKLE